MTYQSRNTVDVIGEIWWPMGVPCAQRYELSDCEVSCLLAEAGAQGQPFRDAVDDWVRCNTGDFSRIIDFRAVLNGAEIKWDDEESELVYNDCMFGDEA